MYRLSRPLILASKSPRRKMLLRQFGFDFTVKVSNLPEVSRCRTPRARAMDLARQKAAASGKAIHSGITLGFDTIVFLKGRILEKPSDEREAREMLSALSGATHTVYTGMALLLKPENRFTLHCEKTRVTFRTLEAKEIKNYISTGEPFDKAGAYGIQGMGGTFVEKVAGCFFNVVGLPVSPLMSNLKPYIRL